ncbi:type II secretion system F family protein [Alcaligenaceae bacterium CGII-47]|nr:type II secretion system F family protein [Alcaligenaceae bacterium CGII-47]
MLWIGVLMAGVAVAIGVWFICRPWAMMANVAATVPVDRLRWVWPWVMALEPVCAPLLSWRMRRKFSVLGQQAGLSDAWSPEQWLTLRIMMGALVAGVCVLGVLLIWPQPGSGRLLFAMLFGALLGFWWPDALLRRRARDRRTVMLREFPFMLDLMTLCVEAGLSLHGALAQVAQYAPEGPLRYSLRQALSVMRAGVTRSHALHQWAEHCAVPAVRGLVLSLEQADQLGMNLGPLLRAQAAEQRSERFLRAEKLALEAPVKMLFPMVVCIFPCTFLIIGFPVAIKLLNAGF